MVKYGKSIRGDERRKKIKRQSLGRERKYISTKPEVAYQYQPMLERGLDSGQRPLHGFRYPSLFRCQTPALRGMMRCYKTRSLYSDNGFHTMIPRGIGIMANHGESLASGDDP
jgi:hypothetical protein